MNINTEVFYKEHIEKTLSSLNTLYETLETQDLQESKNSIKKQINRTKMVYDKLVHDNKIEKKPWGYYKILYEQKEYKIKEIMVLPKHRLSLQKHLQRAEHWCILQGMAQVVIEHKVVYLSKGDSVDIPANVIHRIENVDSENLIFIEIQTGSYLGEDDIIRLADDFGRLKP